MDSPDPGSGSHSRPRWLKAFGIALIVLVVVGIVLLIAGGHGPGRHSGSGPFPASCHQPSPCLAGTLGEITID